MEIVNPSQHEEYREKDRSWHSGMNKYAKKRGDDFVQKFADPFLLERSSIDQKFVDLFYGLKEKRNSIAHTLSYPDSSKFKTDMESLFILICYVYHINDPLKEDVNYFPWNDWEAEFE